MIVTSLQLLEDLTELEKRHAALVEQRERAAGELETAQAQLTSTAPTARTIDAATVAQSRLAALDAAVVSFDAQIAETRKTLTQAQEAEAEAARRQRMVKLRAERDAVLESFTRTRQQAHDALFAACEEMARLQYAHIKIVGELSEGRRDIPRGEMPLSYSIETALATVVDLASRKVIQERSEAFATSQAEVRSRVECKRREQAEVTSAALETEAQRIFEYRKGEITMDEARRLAAPAPR